MNSSSVMITRLLLIMAVVCFLLPLYTLANHWIEHETEISLFNMKDYLEFKANPEEKW